MTGPEDYTAQLHVAAPPAAVFAALTTVDGLSSWWTTATGDGYQGGELRFTFNSDVPLVVRVEAAERDCLVRWACVSYPPVADWAGTTISFELAAGSDGGCELSFRHHGLTPQLECYQDCRRGWDHFIPSLRTYVESGTGDPRGSAADLAWRAALDQTGAVAAGRRGVQS